MHPSSDSSLKAIIPNPADDHCTLLQGNFDKFVQFLLAVLSLSVLVYKRHVERPRRTFIVWFMDSSKQVSDR